MTDIRGDQDFNPFHQLDKGELKCYHDESAVEFILK